MWARLFLGWICVLHRVTYKGAPIVKGKRVTGFTNDEEEEVHLIDDTSE